MDELTNFSSNEPGAVICIRCQGHNKVLNMSGSYDPPTPFELQSPNSRVR